MHHSQSVLETGKKLSDDNTIGQEEIQQRLAQFVDHWKELKDLSGARRVSHTSYSLFEQRHTVNAKPQGRHSPQLTWFSEVHLFLINSIFRFSDIHRIQTVTNK